MNWCAVVADEQWTGHGEGGTLSRIVIQHDLPRDPHSTGPEERAALQRLADEINALKVGSNRQLKGKER